MNAVFFDLDGTLADTRADLAAAVNHTRRDFGLAELPEEQVIACVGCGARRLFEGAIPEVPDFDAAYPVFKERYAEHAVERCTLYPGVRQTLAELADRGWLMGVNTNKPRFATMLILEHFGLKRYFGNAVVAGGDCPQLKPSDLTLRECAARMRGHRLSSRDWMVGDNWTDMDCAAACGIRSAFCTFGFGHLNESRHTVRINRFDELLRHLKAEEA